jgi:hypothetical protein
MEGSAMSVYQPTNWQFVDETGKTHGDWKVLGLDRKKSKQKGIAYWRCRCHRKSGGKECGNVRSVSGERSEMGRPPDVAVTG